MLSIFVQMLVMKEYLLYLLGELTEYHSEQYPDSRFWKNDEYGVVLELEKSGNLYIHYKIWANFSIFFSSEYADTQRVMKSVLEEHLKLGVITPNSLFCISNIDWKSI
jgi:hypothetical protein